MPLRKVLLAILLPLPVALAAQGPDTRAAGAGAGGENPAASRPADDSPYGVHGTIRLEYIGRWTSGHDDQDGFAAVDLDAGDPRRHLITFHAAGRLGYDFDGGRNPQSPYFNVDDTYGALSSRLYSAYVDVNGVAGNPFGATVRRIRTGRQIMYDTPVTLYLDGVSVETQPLPGLGDTVLSGFMGQPSNWFESSSSGDVAYGGAAQATPWRGGTLRFDYVHVTDRWLSQTSKDDLLGFRVDQAVGPGLWLHGHANLLDDELRDMAASGTWSLAESGTSVTARYTALLSDQDQHSINLDYFTPIAFTWFAYDQYEIYGHQDLGEHAYVDGGVQFRELREESREGTFNHEFRRYYLTPGVQHWPTPGTSLGVTGEYWDAGGDRFTSMGADLTQELDARWRASVGTSFDLFRYDALVGLEDENVQTTWARLEYRPQPTLRFRLGYQFENGQSRDDSRLALTIQKDF
jgi:hypothetical protein